MATVLIPTPLRKFTNQSSKVTVMGNNVSEVISNLVTEYPGIQKHLLDPTGTVRPFINIFVDEYDIRSLQHQNTQVGSYTTISIIPAIAGGNF